MRGLMCRGKLWYFALAGLLAAAARLCGDPPPPSQPRPAPVVPVNALSAAPNPMDVPLRLIGEAAQVHQRVQDYTCLFVKTEQINGRMEPESVIQMKVRTQPFSVYMRWMGPKSMAGQEVSYVAGQNNGMMRVHATGLRGAVGFVSIDPLDSRAMQHSRHVITDAGVGHLIDQLRQNWEMEKQLNKTQVRIADYDFAKRKCTRVETIHADPRAGRFYSHRTVVYFDKETKLPIRFEAYDWPRQGGPPEGELVECYSYVEVRFNVGLADDTFRK